MKRQFLVTLLFCVLFSVIYEAVAQGTSVATESLDSVVEPSVFVISVVDVEIVQFAPRNQTAIVQIILRVLNFILLLT